MKIDSEKNLIWISGDVPGARNSFVRLTITKKAEK
jgi:ribosomal protein L3